MRPVLGLVGELVFPPITFTLAICSGWHLPMDFYIYKVCSPIFMASRTGPFCTARGSVCGSHARWLSGTNCPSPPSFSSIGLGFWPFIAALLVVPLILQVCSCFCTYFWASIMVLLIWRLACMERPSFPCDFVIWNQFFIIWGALIASLEGSCDLPQWGTFLDRRHSTNGYD